jgi:phosphatidylglycerophosphatase A
MKRLAHKANILPILFSSVLGVGFIPFAPGTFGSLVGVFLAIYLQFFANFRAIIAILALFFTLLAVPLVKLVLKNPPRWGRRHQANIRPLANTKDAFDPSYIVIDEVIGQLFTIFIASFALELTLHTFFMCFFAFRVFDILKPWPIRQVEVYFGKKEQYRNVGIIIDDVLAGGLAGGVLVCAEKLLCLLSL